MVKCNTCGALYEPVQGGVKYFHACPPVTMVTIYDLTDQPSTIPLSDLKAQRVKVLRDDGTTAIVEADALKPTDVRQRDTFVERAQKRDENVTIAEAGKPGIAKADGTGITKL